MTTIRENGAGLLASYSYDSSGRRMSVILGNGAVTSYSYHDDDALKTLSHNTGGTANDVNWSYGFNKVNRLTSKIMTGGVNLGFYQWQPQSVRTDTYVSNGLNQYSAVAGSLLTYDANGNLTGDGVWNYIYDTENMLLSASKPGTSASYIYDPLGRRSAKTVSGILTTFLDDGVEEIADYNASGALLRRYVHGPGVDEYLVMYTGTGTANKSYFHANHQGSIVAMSNASGNVTEMHSYDSYGNSGSLTGTPFRYTGRRLDAETGLYYYRARYYSPAIGRFLQTDPIGYGDSLNWYAYVSNDPVNGTDPMGLSACPGSQKNTCIQADTFKQDKSGKQNIALSSKTEAAALAGKDKVAVTSGTKEKLGFVVKNETGNESVTVNGDAKTSSSGGVDRARSGIPDGATAVIHGHIDGRSDGLIDAKRGKGDAQTLTKGLPNITVSEGRAGVRELVGGQLQFRMIDGKMTNHERRQLQKNINRQQKLFLKRK